MSWTQLDRLLLARRTRLAAVAAALTDPELVAASEADAVDLVRWRPPRPPPTPQLSSRPATAPPGRPPPQRTLARLRSDLDGALAAWAPRA